MVKISHVYHCNITRKPWEEHLNTESPQGRPLNFYPRPFILYAVNRFCLMLEVLTVPVDEEQAVSEKDTYLYFLNKLI